MFVHKYNNIITIENLLFTWERFVRGKKNKKDVIVFGLKLAENIIDIQNSLIGGTYEHNGYLAFNISDPKPRNIHKATVRDRVVHHLIYKELYPYFDSRFIFDSYSCRENKGTHRAIDRFRYFERKVSKNNTRTCYVLKCDIRKFFANIDHQILKSILNRQIEDKNILCLLEKVIDSFKTKAVDTLSAIAESVSSFNKGLPLGNLTSQLLVNIYMHEFDFYVKQRLQVKYYIRYADDFVFLSDDREYLEELLPQIDKFLREKLRLELHEKKVSIATYFSGIDFLGWVHFLYHRQVRVTTKRKIIRNLKRYPKPETINSYRGLLSHGNTYKLRKMINIFANKAIF